MKAQITTVNLGIISIEGLLLTDGTFAVAVPQIAAMVDLDPNYSSQQIKRALSHTSTQTLAAETVGTTGYADTHTIVFSKATTPFNPKAVNIVNLESFSRIILELAFKGNPKAIELSRILTHLSLQQLFCDAFGIKFEKDDREQWLAIRAETKALYREFSDAVQIWIHREPRPLPEGLYYANAADSINTGLFGLTSKQIKTQLGITKSCLNRDHFGFKALKRIDTVQEGAARKMTRNSSLTPSAAVEMIIDFNEIQVADFAF